MTTRPEPEPMPDAEDRAPDETTVPAADAAGPAPGTGAAEPGAAQAGPASDADADAADSASKREPSSSLAGTVPAWWTWVGRHRRPVALVAGLVAVAVVAGFVVAAVVATRPKEVVQSYLDAIRAGDTEAALAIAGEPDDDQRVRVLSADALADDWSVDAVVERHVRDDEADVDVTIRAGDTTRQGRFHLVADGDGWTMESPFVKVDLSVGELDVVELGGVRQPVEGDPTRVVPLLLFPGVYDLYPSLADRLDFPSSPLIATPSADQDTVVRVTTGHTLTEAGVDAAQDAVNAHVDDCADQPVIDPPGCPFDISETSAVWRLGEVSEVAWTVLAHPEVHVGQEPGGVHLVVRKPGTVRVTGTGVPEPGAARTPFTLTCEFGLGGLELDVTADGIAVEGVTGDDYSAPLGTLCF